jgi:hypothetical protein
MICQCSLTDKVNMQARNHARLALMALIYLSLIMGGGYAGDWIARSLQITVYPHNEPMFHKIIMMLITAYILLTTLPFVPGIEVGLGLIVTFGPPIVPLVYAATLVALTISYSVGRLVPERWLAAGLGKVGLLRAEKMVTELSALIPEERVSYLIGRAPKKWVPFLLRHRLWALALLINLPGSALIGGGGGICMAVGVSRLVTYPQFILTIALAVSPLPFAILVGSIMGHSLLE